MADETMAARAPSGTHDVLWPESTRWEALLAAFAAQVEAAGYGLAHTPIFEDVRVFRRGIGEGSDVVGKEMYEFEDRGGRTLALRPEGTAPLVRAFVQHRPPLPWKAWYATPAFRYERPQAGRYRQHHQLGVEALGPADPDLDVEVICAGRRLLPLAGPGLVRPADQLDGRRRVPPGLPRAAARRTWPSAATELCPEHRERLEANPLRVLDCKREECREATADAPAPGRPPVRPLPRSTSTGCGPAWTRWACPTSSTTGWSGGSTTTPGPPSSSPRRRWSRPRTASAAGGRYDGLVEMLGGPPTPGIGFGIGIERLLLACDAEGVFAGGPGRPRRLRGRRGRRRVGPGPHRRAAPGRAAGRPGLRRPVDEVPAEVGRPLRGPGGPDRGARRGGRGYGVPPAPAGDRGAAHRAARRRWSRRCVTRPVTATGLSSPSVQRVRRAPARDRVPHPKGPVVTVPPTIRPRPRRCAPGCAGPSGPATSGPR